MLRPDRLSEDLERFAAYGRTASGGVTRVAFSRADADARGDFTELAEAAGLTVRTDSIGNLFARLPGSEPGPALWVGSHLDSVIEGGRFDGALGVLTALEVARALAEQPEAPRRSFEVVAFTGEEGSRFPRGTLGSKVVAGVITVEEAHALEDREGISVKEAMRTCGYGAELPPPPNPREEAFAYLELHIEQGRSLETAGVPIGVVEAIAGLNQRTYRFHGEANHAGTTRIAHRRDAGLGAASLMLTAERLTQDYEEAVATCGRLEVRPGALNIIPGEAGASFDLRAPHPHTLHNLVSALDLQAAKVASARALELEIIEHQQVPPGPLDEGLRGQLAAGCEAAQLPYLELHSGAIHDALLLSRRIPAAMLFVPSRGGRSHCPEEYTSPEHVTAGLQALYAAACLLVGDDSGD